MCEQTQHVSVSDTVSKIKLTWKEDSTVRETIPHPLLPVAHRVFREVCGSVPTGLNEQGKSTTTEDAVSRMEDESN